MKKHCRWWLFAGLWGLSLVQHPLLASQNISSPEPAGEGNFEAYLSGLRERALNGDPAAARELAVHYDVEGNAAETSKWMSEYVSLAEKRANNGDGFHAGFGQAVLYRQPPVPKEPGKGPVLVYPGC